MKKEITAMLKDARESFQKKAYNDCLRKLLPILDRHPENTEAVELARTVLYLGMDSGNPEPLNTGLLSDPILDPHLAECASCRRFWAVNPFFKDAAGVTVLNAVGGYCAQCARCFCRQCAAGKGLMCCPECGKRLEVLKTPNGRTRTPGHHAEGKRKPSSVLLFKEPPDPPVMRSYLRLVLEALCPEALYPGTDLYAETSTGPVDQTYALIRALHVRPKLNSKTHDFFVERFTDRDGGKGLLLKVYRKKEDGNNH